MGFCKTIRSGLMLGLALNFLSSNVWAQDDWPTVEDFYTEGSSLPPGELERLLAEKPAVIGFELGTGSFWAIFRCNGSNTTIIKNDTPLSSVERGECRVEDSTVCILSPSTGGEECIVVRRMPGFDLLFADIAPTDITLTPEQHIAERGDQPAVAVAIAELDLYNLAAASGEIGIGLVSINLPTRYQFALFEASGFPFAFGFYGQTEVGYVVLNVGQYSWPDRYAPLSPDHSTLHGAKSRASDNLARLEESLKGRDLGRDETGASLEVLTYRSTFSEQENGHCLRIHETISTAERPEGMTDLPSRSLISHQGCISISDGAVVVATLAFTDLPQDQPVGEAESEAEAILDTLQLGTLSGEGRAEEMTYDRFLALQGGDPELSWEMLDCVQGWNRAAQINGCNHSITRYNQLIEAGSELIAQGSLPEDQRIEVQETVDSSGPILAIIYSVRAALLEDEAPSQAREDCLQAQMMAARLEDAELIARFAECGQGSSEIAGDDHEVLSSVDEIKQLIDGGQIAKALALTAQLNDQAPGDLALALEMLFGHAESLYRDDAPTESAELFEAILVVARAGNATIRDEPEFRFLLARLNEDYGRVLQRLDRNVEALEALDEALAFASRLVSEQHDIRSLTDLMGRVQIYRGRSLEALERHGEAIDAYLEAVQNNPDDDVALKHYGVLAFMSGEYDKAFEALESAVVLDPEYESALHWLAWAYATAGLPDYRRPDRAVELARAVIQIQETAGRYDTLGAALLSSGNHKEALAAYRQAVALDMKYATRLADNLKEVGCLARTAAEPTAEDVDGALVLCIEQEIAPSVLAESIERIDLIKNADPENARRHLAALAEVYPEHSEIQRLQAEAESWPGR